MFLLLLLQEAQRQTDDTFQQFMADNLQANWQRAKRRLLDSMLPSGGQGGITQGLAPHALSQPGSQTQGRKGRSCGSVAMRQFVGSALESENWNIKLCRAAHCVAAYLLLRG